MKQFGNSSVFFVALLFVFSCKQYKFDTSGRYTRGYLSNYSNDKISLLYGVNVGFSQKYIKTDTFYDKKVDKKILSILNFNTSNTTLLFSSISPMEAPIHTICLYYKGSIKNNLYEKKVLKDSLFFLKKTLFHHKYLITESLIPFENGYVITIYYLPIILKNETTQLTLEQTLEHDARQNTERIFNKLRDFELSNPFNLANDSFNESPSKNYLAAVALQKQENNYQNKQDKSNYYQALATYYSFAHQIKESKETWKKLDNLYGENTKKDSTGLMPISKKQVFDLIKNEQVVMFNEAHHHPEHRYFLGTLLDTLYQAGFRYLALESITHADSLNASSPKIPTFNDGFYIREPIYANMVKQALHLGYTLVEYEAWEGDRETAQAQNLYNQTLKKDPKAKVIVLAGYSHIEEKPIDGKPWMASIFKSISGVNPYTINQTEAMFRKSINNQTQDIYSLQIDSTSNDLIIYNNIDLSKTNHCFYSSESKTIQITIDADSLAENQNYALLIYKKEELEKTNQAIPVFVKILEKGQNQALATLCVGKYIAFCKNHYGDNTWNKNIIVEK